MNNQNQDMDAITTPKTWPRQSRPFGLSASLRNVRSYSAGSHSDRSLRFVDTLLQVLARCSFTRSAKVPAFLGSSFAFLAGYFAIAPNGERELLPYACFGVFLSGFMYVILAFFIKIGGVKRVMRYFPPIVTGPIIISIGLSLSGSAITNASSNWGIAVVAVFLVVLCNIWGKGMIKIIPILVGTFGSYLVAALSGNVDFSNVASAKWIGLPFEFQDTVFDF